MHNIIINSEDLGDHSKLKVIEIMFNLFLAKLLDTFEGFCISCGSKYLIKFGLQGSTLTQGPVAAEGGAFHVGSVCACVRVCVCGVCVHVCGVCGVCLCVCAGEGDAEH